MIVQVLHRRKIVLGLALVAALGVGCDQKPVPAAKTDVATQGNGATAVQSDVPVTVPGTAQSDVPVATQSVPVTTQNNVPVTAQSNVPVKTSVKRVTPTVAEPKPQTPSTVTVAAGTAFSATLQNTITTDKAHVGDPVQLVTAEAVSVNGSVVVPVGSTVRGTVTQVKAAGRVKGGAEITIRFTEIVLPSGKTVSVTCESLHVAQKGDGKETAAEIGGGSAIGGVLGGVLGGKHDVLKGAAIGAVLGTGVAVVTKGEQVTLPAGKTIHVRLAAPAVVGGVTL
jgi:hypothetical protein